MGYHINSERERDLREAYDGPVVSAAPGYALLDEKQPNGEPQRVIAWRIGRSWTLPRDHARVHGGRALRDSTGWPCGPVL